MTTDYPVGEALADAIRWAEAGAPYPPGARGWRPAIGVLAAEVQRLQALTPWQPIETAPRDGTALWLYRPGQVLTDNGYVWCQLSPDNGFFACVSGGYTAVREATHWMLPLAGPSRPNT